MRLNLGEKWMAVVGLIIGLACAASLSGCSDDASALTAVTDVLRLEVLTASWQVSVASDGSGTVSFGSTAGDMAIVPAGTFDFPRTLHRLTATGRTTPPRDRNPGALTVLLLRKDRTRTTLYSSDRVTLIELIEQGLEGSGDARLKGIWKERPLR